MNYIVKKNRFNQDRFFCNDLPNIPKLDNEKFETQLLIDIHQKNLKYGGMRYQNYFKKSYDQYPLISVIVPNLNGTNLRTTLDSILMQKYPNIEIIVIDGGSEDNNINFLFSEYQNDIDIFISQKDNGIYDGWNKGLKLCLGKYVGIINSNDFFYENAFNYLIKYINKFHNYDFILGAVEKEKVYAGFRPNDINLKFNIYPSTVIGFFIKLNSQKKVGLYNLKYKCSSDYDMFYRIIKHNKMSGIPTSGYEVFGKFELGGFSSKIGFFEHLKEELVIRYDNKQNVLILFYIFFGRCASKAFKLIKKFLFF